MSVRTSLSPTDAWGGAPPLSSTALPALRRRWPLVLAAAALASLAAYAVSDVALPPVYSSSTTLIVHNEAVILPDDGAAPIEPFVDDQSLSETFEQLALQPAVAEPVADQLGMRRTRLLERLTVHAVPRTPLIEITYEADSPAAAARGAQAYTAQFVSSTQRASYLPGRVLVVSGATRPTEPTGNRGITNALVAGAAALALALGLVLARAASDARKEQAHQVQLPREERTVPGQLAAWRAHEEELAQINGRGGVR